MDPRSVYPIFYNPQRLRNFPTCFSRDTIRDAPFNHLQKIIECMYADSKPNEASRGVFLTHLQIFSDGRKAH